MVLDLNFTVEKQILSYINEEKLVNLSNNYLRLFCNYSDEWEDLTKFILLKNDSGGSFLFNYDEMGIKVPSIVLSGKSFKISTYGVNNDDQRITTNELRLSLIKSGYTDQVDSVDDDTVDVIGDIYIKIDTINTRLDELNNVDEIIDARNELWINDIIDKINQL